MLCIFLVVVVSNCATTIYVGGLDEIEKMGIKKEQVVKIDTLKTRVGKAYLVHYHR
jgi:hypothetical protein